MELLLPTTISEGRIDTLLKWVAHISTPQKTKLRVNWRRVTTISPGGLAILACIADTAEEQLCNMDHVFIKKHFRQFPPIQRLTGAASKSAGLPDPATNNYAFENAALWGLAGSLDMEIVNSIIKRLPNPSEEQIFAIRLMMNELMVNAKDHAGAERFYVFAGIVEKELRAGVLDMGVTIPAKLEQKYTFKDDTDAIALALKEGVTTRRQRVGGLGLSHAFEILKNHSGQLTLVSRHSQLRRYFKGGTIRNSHLKHKLPGTWCFLKFPLEQT